jgi:hypothetical protein
MKDIWCRKRLTRWQRFWWFLVNKCDCPAGECWPMGREGKMECRP